MIDVIKLESMCWFLSSVDKNGPWVFFYKEHKEVCDYLVSQGLIKKDWVGTPGNQYSWIE